ncbi:MAG: GTPase ObgE, partial [Actinomycetota bacterium]
MIQFVDQVTLHLRAGNGGDGCVSIKREKFKPLAGPDGADGGDGGSISLIADPDVTTLLEYHFRPHQQGGDGAKGAGDFRNGATGKDVVLPVPVGTVVKDADGKLIADLDEAGMTLVVAEGGQGGLGNAALASSKRKAPGFALLGVPGWSGEVILELKTVADVA